MIKDFANNHFPDPLYALAGSTYSILHPKKPTRVLYPVDGCWRVITRDERYYTLKGSIDRGSKVKQQAKYSRYTDEEFCSIEPDDLVVDVGAFVGEFALPASRRAESVLAIEPDPRTFRCLARQTAAYENISVVNELPYETHTTVTFESADDGSESSIINVDEGDFTEMTMTTTTLDSLLAERDISHVDYLKMDAEGAEPEVLRGLKDTSVDRLAIDVGAERDGAGTKDEVTDILEELGYEWKYPYDETGFPVLFAKSR